MCPVPPTDTRNTYIRTVCAALLGWKPSLLAMIPTNLKRQVVEQPNSEDMTSSTPSGASQSPPVLRRLVQQASGRTLRAPSSRSPSQPKSSTSAANKRSLLRAASTSISSSNTLSVPVLQRSRAFSAAGTSAANPILISDEERPSKRQTTASSSIPSPSPTVPPTLPDSEDQSSEESSSQIETDKELAPTSSALQTSSSPTPPTRSLLEPILTYGLSTTEVLIHPLHLTQLSQYYAFNAYP